MARSRLESRLRQAATAIMPRGAHVGVTAADPVAPTFALSIRVGSATHELLTGWADEGWPADVTRLLRVAPRLDAVAAHALSVGAREVLDERGIGWFDETLAANLVTKNGLVIVRQGEPRPRKNQPSESWTNSTIAVAEAILTGTEPLVEPVQHATHLSRGAVAKALSRLERDRLLSRRVERGPESGRRLTDPGALLDRYATAVADSAGKARPVRLHRLWNDPMDALARDIAPALDTTGLPWAVTGAAASMLLAPYLSNITVIELYVADELASDIGRVEDTLDARTVDRGHRIEIRRLPSPVAATTGELIGGVRCAPDVRVYADLAAKDGRFAEAAHHLREVRIDARTRA